MEDDRPTAGRADLDENEEDALPDWRQFAKFAKSLPKSKDEHTPFIPKRGEKDFEPIPFSSSLSQSSKEATLSQYQLNTLNESRSALFSSLSSGSRFHSSRAYNSFTWRPKVEGGRASCDAGSSAYGVHFSNLGRHSAERKRLELLPEEALYMVERGAIELWREVEEGDEDAPKVPMTVQQAWAEIIGHDELTVERFQVYAHLKRLGYVLTRARASPHPQTKAKPELPRRSLLALLALPFSALRHFVFQLVSSLQRLPLLLKSNAPLLHLTRLLRRSEGISRPLLFGRRWATYDQMFGRLQVIPTGHDAPLPRPAIPHTRNILEPLVPAIHPPSTTPGLPDREQHPYQIFYHIYKPVTKFRKTAPPPPDFRLVVINANTTPLPDLFEFAFLFSTVPFPAENTLLPPPPVARVGLPPPTPRFRPRTPPTPPTLLQKIRTYLPGGEKKKFKPSPYPRLKTGRRSVLVAVVDNGTTSLLRFSEAEFAKMPWLGTPRGA